MSATPLPDRAIPVPPPNKHQLALMIWVAVFPTLTVVNLMLGTLLEDLPVVLRTLVLATIAVPIVVYGIMPLLHKTRRDLYRRNTRRVESTARRI